MSRGTREVVNLARHLLNANRAEDEPAWTFGDTIELMLVDAYPTWQEVRDTLSRHPELLVQSKPKHGADGADAEPAHRTAEAAA